MIWRLAADAVLLLHGLFILFAVFGGLLVLWRRWLVWLHLPAMAWAALVVTMGWVCPLTPLEVQLRQTAGDAGYSGGFIEHYLVLLIYPPGLTRQLQILLGVAVLVINLLVYGLLLRRRQRRH
ncbi:MAG: DUF2784 domain-containing protein [Marinobacter sp.]|uniref:DUF2784 domain-containing protein n=1 Tax=Marinobacter sp. TaxID=50741 RepID=UPI00299E17C2|nr:DUF2784 domain-containing protein [Marinobacter sp.]MDX1634469.1 DUF2784 domain-containing protein [Marinobacter sp.]